MTLFTETKFWRELAPGNFSACLGRGAVQVLLKPPQAGSFVDSACSQGFGASCVASVTRAYRRCAGPVTRKSPVTQTRLSACDRADLLDWYAKGERVKDLAERFGVHRSTVRALATRAGLPLRRVSERPRQVREEAVDRRGRS